MNYAAGAFVALALAAVVEMNREFRCKVKSFGRLAVATGFLLVCLPYAVRSSARTTAALVPNASDKTKSSRSIVLPPEKSSPVKIPRFDHPPAIDGKLDDEVWKQAVKLKDFYQTSPGYNIAPSQPTALRPEVPPPTAHR